MRMLEGSAVELRSVESAKLSGEDMPADGAELAAPGRSKGSKLKISIEKKIENIWLESEQLGWTYNDFVSHLLEVLIVLNYRGFSPKAQK